MKRLVLFVEGEGEGDAMPCLVKRILATQSAWDVLFLDENTFRVGQVNKLIKDDYHEWKRHLRSSLKRHNVGGVLLVLDGDIKKVGTDVFCAATVAKNLAQKARDIGAGTMFSVAVVFARREYESWLLAGIESIAGKRLSDGRQIASGAKPPDGYLEEIRDAKDLLDHMIEGGYKPTRDQATLTEMIDVQKIRERQLRSFKRLESGLTQIVAAIRNHKHVATP